MNCLPLSLNQHLYSDQPLSLDPESGGGGREGGDFDLLYPDVCVEGLKTYPF